MRLPSIVTPASAFELPLWPPLLATRGPGSRSALHTHHAMHFIVCLEGSMRVRAGASARWRRASGVLTAPDAPHAIDASGCDVLLVFLDPDSDVGRALWAVIPAPVRLLSAAECTALVRDPDPVAIMRTGGVAWTQAALTALGGPHRAPRRVIHPRVRALLRLLRTGSAGREQSLETLARAVGLSPGRLMHAFTESIGLPLRPYLLWLKLQRAAGAIVAGASLTDAAHAAGFADAAHLSRTFRRMFGAAPSMMRPARS
jgi:AraC-like DNA-binding protein